MTYWIREFETSKANSDSAWYSETANFPPVRVQNAECRREPEWRDDTAERKRFGKMLLRKRKLKETPLARFVN